MPERDVQKTVDSLCDSAEPIASALCEQLTNLTREEQSPLDERWATIPLEKRRRLVTFLSEQADQDVLLDFSAIFRRGLKDSDATVRNSSVQGLREDESVTLIRPFLHLLNDDTSMDVRANAARALGRFVLQGELGYLPGERNQELIEALVHVISNPMLPNEVRRRAVESLAYSGDERVRGIIARAYEDSSEAMQQSAVLAMGRSADEYWRGSVRTELMSENPDMRLEAARAAGELADPRAVHRLILLLEDADPGVRQIAVWALGQIGGSDARKALQRVTASDNPAMRQAARTSLAEMSLLDEENPGLYSPSLFEEDEPDPYDFDDEDDDEEAWDEDEEEYDEEEYDEEDEDEDWQTLEVRLGTDLDFDEDEDLWEDDDEQ